MTDRSAAPLASIEALVPHEVAQALKWKVLLATDFGRVEMLAAVSFDDLSAAGKSEAERAGYGAGESVTVQVRAEREHAPLARIPPKSEPITIHWVTGIRQEAPRDAKASDKGGCFVATAAFGSPLAAEIEILRHLRDVHLRPHAIGRRFLHWYEENGPAMADLVRRSRVVRVVARSWITIACRLANLVERTLRCERTTQ